MFELGDSDRCEDKAMFILVPGLLELFRRLGSALLIS